MISDTDVTPVGRINKTHGTEGELSITFTDDTAYDTVDVESCLLLSIEGILVPFFVDGVRTRGGDTLLISLEGEDSQEKASAFVGLEVYMMKKDLPEAETEETDGLYATQLVGYTAYVNANESLGVIDRIDDTTDNPLFILTAEDGTQMMIPIADEFIADIDTSHRTITFDLPEGLLELNQ